MTKKIRKFIGPHMWEEENISCHGGGDGVDEKKL
jgi:hypothetical protein